MADPLDLLRALEGGERGIDRETHDALRWAIAELSSRAAATEPTSASDPCRCQNDATCPHELGWARAADCADCNLDTHICRGCGEPVDHDEGRACTACRASHAEQERAQP